MSVGGFLIFFGRLTVSLIQPLLELTCRDWQDASEKIFYLSTVHISIIKTTVD